MRRFDMNMQPAPQSSTQPSLHQRLGRWLTAALACCWLGLPTLAQAEVVLILSTKSSVNELSLELAGEIFMGKRNTLPSGAKMQALDQAEGSVTRDNFYRLLAHRDSAQMTAYWARMIFTGKGQPPIESGDAASIKRFVAANPGLIGYIERSELDKTVKEVLVLR